MKNMDEAFSMQSNEEQSNNAEVNETPWYKTQEFGVAVGVVVGAAATYGTFKYLDHRAAKAEEIEEIEVIEKKK